MVVCEEIWEEVDPDTAEIVIKNSRHAWVSSHPLSYQNVLERCNQGARFRWGIENSMKWKSITATTTSMFSPILGTQCADSIT